MNGEEEEFAIRLREALNKSGKSQKELSEETGIAESTISQYLSGKYNPKQEKINILAQALGVTELWLRGKIVSSQKRTTLGASEIKKYAKYMMNDDELYEMEFSQVKAEFEEKIERLNDTAIYNLVDKIEDLSTIDDKDWELLVLFNSITEEAKEKLLEYGRDLNKIPEFLKQEENK